jgi:hypothetical protein
MLARRFTIVCLVMALFGMLFASLVVEAGRSARSWEIGTIVPCVFDQGLACSPSQRN